YNLGKACQQNICICHIVYVLSLFHWRINLNLCRGKGKRRFWFQQNDCATSSVRSSVAMNACFNAGVPDADAETSLTRRRSESAILG
ncbi:hypothetical protein COCON_G00109900, partial [Conger conger]